jgi:hypothetical protein
MLRARASGALVHSEADYQLHIVYLWYEKQPQRAVELLQDLQVRHPHNPYFLQAMADSRTFYIDDTRASLRTWQTLLDEAQRGEVAEPRMAEAMARVGICIAVRPAVGGRQGTRRPSRADCVAPAGAHRHRCARAHCNSAAHSNIWGVAQTRTPHIAQRSPRGTR